MSDTFIINMKHYLNEYGAVPENLPGSAKNMAKYFGEIVAYTTSLKAPLEGNELEHIHCRRKPKRKPCKGSIFSFLNLDDFKIVWHCTKCGDNGIISGWEDSFFDCTFQKKNEII